MVYMYDTYEYQYMSSTLYAMLDILYDYSTSSIRFVYLLYMHYMNGTFLFVVVVVAVVVAGCVRAYYKCISLLLWS